jgi:NAD(P)-dependent dehydrogenase (short-subunit alcohol dehydrogenase family)
VRLAGKRAIITGAASGIGRASARAFAAQGAALVLADVSEEVFEVARAIVAGGGRALALQLDVGDDLAVRSLVARAEDELGGLDIMFANAGISGALAPIFEHGEADFMQVLRVNLLGVFFCIKYAVKSMLAADSGKGRPGAIVCTASVAGLRAGGGPAPYSASKAGVISLVQSTACQLAGTGIRVNAICPGLIETGMTRPIFEMARAAGKADKIGQLNPLRRAGEPEEIAAAVVMLASDEASYLNGQAIVVDGGLSATLPFIPGRLA